MFYRYFPDGIDIYFDNVGTEMLEAAVANMNTFGRVAVCGVISEYTDAAKRAAPNMLEVVYKRITIRGFLAADHMNLFADFSSATADHLRKGRIHVLEDISQCVESIPAAFVGLFRVLQLALFLVRLLMPPLVWGELWLLDTLVFEKGDLVAGFISWGEYSIVKGANTLNKLDLMGFPLSYHVGILGLSGLTAYAGFFEVCKPKKGEKVFVSAASGSVGNLVGQYFPDGIDIYFDNVGAEMLEAAVANMNTFGRVAVCGVIAEYTDATKRAAPNMLEVVIKRITIRGFLAPDHMNLFPDFASTTADHLRKGEIHVLEDVSQGLESIPAAFTGLFRGDNIGKTIVQITDE
ncbi:hypothetical protein C3L33_06184, partial [Rhododendron williamsianum]